MSEIYSSYFIGKKISFDVNYCYATFLRFNNIKIHGEKNPYSSYFDYHYSGYPGLYEAIGFLSRKSSKDLREIRDIANKRPFNMIIRGVNGGIDLHKLEMGISKNQYECFINNPMVLSAKIVVIDGDMISIEKETILENSYIMNEIKKMIDPDYENREKRNLRLLEARKITSEWGVVI
jgi:hypothetical protein